MKMSIIIIVTKLFDMHMFNIYVTLHTFNAILITQAYHVLFDNGGGNLEREFSSARAFDMLSAYVTYCYHEN